MDGYYVYLKATKVKVGLYNTKTTPRFISEEFLPTAVSNSKIIDLQEFCREFVNLLTNHLGEKLPQLPLYFILEPELTELFLLTSPKSTQENGLLLEAQIRDRLVDENLDDLYSAHVKIAPFVDQFIGIKKTYLDTLLSVANQLNLELGGVIPLPLALAKSNSDLSSIFIFSDTNTTSVVFSELTGVTFAEKFAGQLALDELKELFWKLSIYNTKKSEPCIYTLTSCEQQVKSKEVKTISALNADQDYEELGLVYTLLEKQPNLLVTPTNLINLLPLPEPVHTNRVPMVVGSSIMSLVLIAGIIIQLTVGFDNIFKAQSAQQKQTVLADQDQATSLPSNEGSQTTPQPSAPPAKEVKRSDLKVRVENGNGVAGSAGKLKTYLEGFGYTVVSVGNSEKTDYSATTVSLPTSLAEYKNLLVNDLKTNYQVEVADTETKSTDYDVLIIAGQN